MENKKSAPTAATVKGAKVTSQEQFTANGAKNQGIPSPVQQIDSGVIDLEMAYDLLQILFDAAESEFAPVRTESPMAEAILNRFNMYLSAATILQNCIAGALEELQTGRDQLNRK